MVEAGPEKINIGLCESAQLLHKPGQLWEKLSEIVDKTIEALYSFSIYGWCISRTALACSGSILRPLFENT